MAVIAETLGYSLTTIERDAIESPSPPDSPSPGREHTAKPLCPPVSPLSSTNFPVMLAMFSLLLTPKVHARHTERRGDSSHRAMTSSADRGSSLPHEVFAGSAGVEAGPQQKAYRDPRPRHGRFITLVSKYLKMYI